MRSLQSHSQFSTLCLVLSLCFSLCLFTFLHINIFILVFSNVVCGVWAIRTHFNQKLKVQYTYAKASVLPKYWLVEFRLTTLEKEKQRAKWHTREHWTSGKRKETSERERDKGQNNENRKKSHQHQPQRQHDRTNGTANRTDRNTPTKNTLKALVKGNH